MTQNDISIDQLDDQMQKDLVSKITEHLQVKDVNGEHVGTVDHMEDGKVKLTKSDSPDGQHHFVDLADVESADEVAVYLNKTREQLNLG